MLLNEFRLLHYLGEKTSLTLSFGVFAEVKTTNLGRPCWANALQDCSVPNEYGAIMHYGIVVC